jgi:hypothetical protein
MSFCKLQSRFQAQEVQSKIGVPFNAIVVAATAAKTVENVDSFASRIQFI